MLDWEYVSDEVLIDQKAYSCPVPAESGGVYQVVPTYDMKERMSDLYYAMIAANHLYGSRRLISCRMSRSAQR